PVLVALGGLAALLVLAPLSFGAAAQASPFGRGAAAGIGAAGAGVALLKVGAVLGGVGPAWGPALAGAGAALVLLAGPGAAAAPVGGCVGVFVVAASRAGAGLLWVLAVALLGSILAAVGAVRIGYAALVLEEEDTRAGAGARSARLLPATLASGAAALLTLVL